MPELNEKKIRKIIDEIFSQALTPNQINMLWHFFLETIDNDFGGSLRELKISFDNVVTEKISVETLRRFAKREGYYQNKEGIEFGGGSKAPKIIALYLTHPRIDKLHIQELKDGHKLISQLAIRFAEYFSMNTDLMDVGYNGSFEQVTNTTIKSDTLIQLEIKSQKKYSYFNIALIFKRKNKFIDMGIDNGLKQLYFNGWGTFIDQNMFFITVQHIRSREKIIYLSLSEPQKDALGRVKKLVLKQYNSLTMVDWEQGNKQIHKNTHHEEIKNILLFQRVENFTGLKIVSSDMIDDEEKVKVDLTDEEAAKQYALERRKKLEKSEFKKSRYARANLKSMKRTTIDMDKEKEKLGRELIQASQNMNTEKIRELLAAGAPVNYPNHGTGNTAFHLSAAYEDWESLEVLLATGECNLLLRNHGKRLASTLAGLSGNVEWRKKLMDMEMEQGKAEDIIPRIYEDIKIETKDDDGPPPP